MFTAARTVDLLLVWYPDLLVISNIKSWTEEYPAAVYSPNIPDTARKTADYDGHVLMFMDDLSSEATHQQLQKSDVEDCVQAFFRKRGKKPYQCKYIGIGQ